MSIAFTLNTIVVATDLAGQSEAALEYARKIATAYGARIVLAHGLDPVEYAAVKSVPGQVLDNLTDHARAALDAMAKDLIREGIHSHSEIRQGAVAQMLVEVAKKYEAGLIVIGTKGAEGAGPVVVGAIAEQLVRISPCAVMAVAADWNAGPFRPTPGGPVLLAIERNEAMEAAAAAACSLAKTFERPLLVLHARQDENSTTLEEFGLCDCGEYPVTLLAKEGDPVDAIAAAIEEYRPCILVTGGKRASETPGPYSTTFALLARSRVPVMCVPPATAVTVNQQETCQSV
jgi:nucleotide-binding universal stress UspA family protein